MSTDSSSVFDDSPAPQPADIANASLPAVKEESQPNSPTSTSRTSQSGSGGDTTVRDGHSLADSQNLAARNYQNVPAYLDADMDDQEKAAAAVPALPGEQATRFEAARSVSESEAIADASYEAATGAGGSAHSSTSDSTTGLVDDVALKHRRKHDEVQDPSPSSGIGQSSGPGSPEDDSSHSHPAQLQATATVVAVDQPHALPDIMDRAAISNPENMHLQAAAQAAGNKRNSLEGEGTGSENDDHDSAIGSLCEPVATQGQPTHYIPTNATDGGNGGCPHTSTPTPYQGPPTLPRSVISLQGGGTGDGKSSAHDTHAQTGSRSATPPPLPGSSEDLPYVNVTPKNPKQTTGKSSMHGQRQTKAYQSGKDSPSLGRPVSMEVNPQYGKPIKSQTSMPLRQSIAGRETLLLLVLLVEGTAHSGTK